MSVDHKLCIWEYWFVCVLEWDFRIHLIFITNISFVHSTHMQDLQEVTQEVHYENYRSERLARNGQVPKRHT